MRIQIASDLHQEFARRLVADGMPVVHVPGADVLVLAGDIGPVSDVVRIYGNFPVPVVYVLGNHEFYGQDWAEERTHAQALAKGTMVHVLDNQELVLGGVRFLGATLWTDYALDGTPSLSASRVSAALSDFRGLIRNGERLFTAQDALADHQRSRAWLQAELVKPFAGKTVLVTHHGVHPKSVHPQYRGDVINPGFVSNLGPLLQQVDLAIHGHIHNTRDYQVKRCRVVANPRGYPLRGSTAQQMFFENQLFNPSLVVEL